MSGMRTYGKGGVLGLLLCGCLLVIGCREDGGGTEATSMPGVGSEFRTAVVMRDAAGAEQRSETLVRVSASNMIVEGKERVVQFAADTLSSLVCYELDGALSIYMKKGMVAGCEVDESWLRFPFGQAIPVDEELLVRQSILGDSSLSCLASWRAKPDGAETIVVNDSTYETLRSRGTFQVAEHGRGDTVWRSQNYVVWYAPTIGYAVREQITSLRITPTTIDTLGSSERSLLDYRRER